LFLKPAFICGAVGLVAVGIVLVFALSGPAPRPKKPPASPPSPVRKTETARVDEEMRLEMERADAKKFSNFLGQIRDLMQNKAAIPRRKNEIEAMITAAEKMQGSRKAEVDAIRLEFKRGLEEAELEALLAAVREEEELTPDLLDAQAKIEALLKEALAAAGSRRAEVETLRAEYARKFEEARKSWKIALGFEEGYERNLEKLERWGAEGGFKITQKSNEVHGGKRALVMTGKNEGGSFWLSGIREGHTYVFSLWGKSTASAGKLYAGFNFHAAMNEEKLLKTSVEIINSPTYRQFTVEAEAPPSSRLLNFWIWKDKNANGPCFIDDMTVTLK
jgi:hypothetical protein